MIKVLHIEDEPAIVSLFKTLLLNNYSNEISYEGSTDSVSKAIDLINEVNPDIVFFDIQLKDGVAFEILDSFEKISFEIVFITAYNEFAIKAFKYHAVNYMLKPFDINEFNAIVDFVIEKINKNRITLPSDDATLRYLKATLGSKKIGIPVSDGIMFVNTDEIVHVEAKGAYCFITLQSKEKITVSKGLKEIESMLPEHTFLRVHHSWIINAKFLKRYYRGVNSYIEMDNGSTIAVSVRKKGSFLDMFG